MKKMTFLLIVFLMGAVSCSGSDYNSETTDNENSTTDERIDLNGKKILIAYWSWSGNTEAVAQEIQRQAGGDLYPMQPLVPYGTTYQEVAYGGRTKDEADNDLRPALADTLSTLGQYDVIFIGTPVWWHMEARLVDTFCDLYANELRGKIVIPFCTFASAYGPETIRGIESHTPNSIHAEGYQSQGRNTSGVASWLSRISSGKGTDLATGIRNAKANKGKSNDLSYSISGARVPTTTHGVLISGGKKYINRF